jgi:hypothetical protein
MGWCEAHRNFLSPAVPTCVNFPDTASLLLSLVVKLSRSAASSLFLWDLAHFLQTAFGSYNVFPSGRVVLLLASGRGYPSGMGSFLIVLRWPTQFRSCRYTCTILRVEFSSWSRRRSEGREACGVERHSLLYGRPWSGCLVMHHGLLVYNGS